MGAIGQTLLPLAAHPDATANREKPSNDQDDQANDGTEYVSQATAQYHRAAADRQRTEAINHAPRTKDLAQAVDISVQQVRNYKASGRPPDRRFDQKQQRPTTGCGRTLLRTLL